MPCPCRELGGTLPPASVLAAPLGTGLLCLSAAPEVTQPRLHVPGEGRTLSQLLMKQPSGARDDALPADKGSSHPARAGAPWFWEKGSKWGRGTRGL